MSDLLFQHDFASEDGKKLAEIMKHFSAQQETLCDEVKTLAGAVNVVAKGFPDGDADAHRRYHELLIEDLEEKRKLRRAIQEKTISGLIWAALVGIGAAIWREVLNQMGRG